MIYKFLFEDLADASVIRSATLLSLPFDPSISPQGLRPVRLRSRLHLSYAEGSRDCDPSDSAQGLRLLRATPRHDDELGRMAGGPRPGVATVGCGQGTGVNSQG